MSSNAEKFCLRWNDFESNISIAFREIREEKDLFDCTLSCGSRQIQAHKLILSACSPFFKSILKMNPHQHPLLYLKGVDFPNLQSVLNFMYHGEVNVAQEELNSFLAVAEDLQVKGLTQNKPDSSPSPVSNKSVPSVGQETKYKVARKAEPARQAVQASAPPPPVQKTIYQQQDDDIQEVVPLVKTEPEQVSYNTVEGNLAMAGTEVVSMRESYVEEGFDYGGYEGVEEQRYEGQDQQDQGYLTSSLSCHLTHMDGKYQCSICSQFTHHSKLAVLYHIEAKHLPNPDGYPCNLCNKVCKTTRALYRHNLQQHRNMDTM